MNCYIKITPEPVVELFVDEANQENAEQRNDR